VDLGDIVALFSTDRVLRAQHTKKGAYDKTFFACGIRNIVVALPKVDLNFEVVGAHGGLGCSERGLIIGVRVSSPAFSFSMFPSQSFENILTNSPPISHRQSIRDPLPVSSL
jgi:hypothetical protein